MAKQLIKGNDAVVRGAILGGCTHFFGYPITPATEITHGAAEFFPRAGGVFLQAEDEVNAINMVYGAAAAGARAMTASSGPGMSLMSEGISFIAGTDLPAVVVNVQRAGPGLGNIWPEQSDYNQSVKGGGHGNYRNLVLAPSSAQEMCDFTYQAFELAERYRMLVMILADAYVGQIMEPVELPTVVKRAPAHPWAVRADRATRENLHTSIFMSIEVQSEVNRKLQEKYALVCANEVRFEETRTEDAEILFVAFGITARVCATAVRSLRARGVRAGLFRPQSLYPFPTQRLAELSKSVKRIIVAELNNGQMVDDVSLAVQGRCKVESFGWMGGHVPSAREIVSRI